MLCAPAFIFTSCSSALLGRPRCGLSIWLSLHVIFNTLFWVYVNLFNERTDKAQKYSKSAIPPMIGKWPPTITRRAKQDGMAWPPHTKLRWKILKCLNYSYFGRIMTRKPKIGNLAKVTELYPLLESKSSICYLRGFFVVTWRHMETKNRVLKWWRQKNNFSEIMGFIRLFGTTYLKKVGTRKTLAL